jgi:hypothetical protein
MPEKTASQPYGSRPAKHFGAEIDERDGVFTGKANGFRKFMVNFP